MMKTLSLALLALSVVLAMVAFDQRISTAQVAGNDSKDLVLDLGDKVTLKLVQIPAGKFLMGSPRDEEGRADDEGLPPGQWIKGEPRVEVTISRPFYLGVYEVTVDQYAQFVKDTGQKHKKPEFQQSGDHPVVNILWDDAQAFCQWLSKLSGKKVVLPSEAQWEYACRAGTTTRFSFGDQARHEDLISSRKGVGTNSVGQNRPNAWGLYDMHGNAMEWCADFYGDYAGAGTDPTGPKDGGPRVARGGSWFFGPGRCRSADRNMNFPDLHNDRFGFRVAVVEGVD